MVGAVRVERRHHVCAACGLGVIPFDEWAGLGKHRVSVGACRLACRVASAWSFDASSVSLRELCGIDLSDQTIRRIAVEHGERAEAWLESSSRAGEPLRAASGHEELSSDGVSVNTRAGWREMRVSVLCKRAAGVPSDPSKFSGLDDRTLPTPAARLVTARIDDAERVGDGWACAARRAGFASDADLSVIGDGAKWIWNQARRVFPRAEHVVDVYHVSEHLHAAGQTLHGESTPEDHKACAWADQRLIDLVRQGPSVLLWQVEREAERAAMPRGRAAMHALAEYLRPNLGALRYGDRLRRGLPIGSGQVEGACKTVARRLKLNAARWLRPNAEAVAALTCLHAADLWDTFWTPAAA
jgi:hypothetical protein